MHRGAGVPQFESRLTAKISPRLSLVVHSLASGAVCTAYITPRVCVQISMYLTTLWTISMKEMSMSQSGHFHADSDLVSFFSQEEVGSNNHNGMIQQGVRSSGAHLIDACRPERTSPQE